MENHIQPNISSAQPPSEVPVPPSKNWPRISLFILLGLIIIAGLVFIGIQIGKRQITSQQAVTEQPAIIPTQVITNPTTPPTESSPSVLIAPSKDAKAIIPRDVFSETLKFVLSETLTSAIIPDYKDVFAVSLFGFTVNNQPVDMLDKEISMEFYVPKELNSYDKIQNEWWVYSIENPTVFRYSKTLGWEPLPSNWNKDSRTLIVKTKQIGSFAVAIPQSSKKFLKE